MMDRMRSVSESQSNTTTNQGKKSGNLSPPTRSIHPLSSSSSLSSLHQTPNKVRKDSAKISLNKVLADYKFFGNIVTFKSQDAYGFIRSEQVTCDVFFSLHHLSTSDKDFCKEGVLGKWVSFTIKDMGKKSMEARKVTMVPSNTSVVFMVGRVMSWIKNGCLIQVTSGQGLHHLNNRLFAPFVEVQGVETGLAGSEVTFKIHVDRNFKMEGRDVRKVEKMLEEPKEEVRKTRKPRRRAVTEGTGVGDDEVTEAEKLMSVKSFSSEQFSDELISKVEFMDSASLSSLFDKQLKARLAIIVQQPVGSKIVVAVIKKAAKLERNNVEEKITRMIMANFMNICSTKQGCAVVQTGLEFFSPSNKVMLAEQLLELDSVEQFTALWVHGSHIFSMMIGLLDESNLTMVGFALSGHYVNLSCHIRHYKPVKALLISLVNTEGFVEILPEVEQELLSLACNKFGHFVVSALLQSSPASIKSRLINLFSGHISSLSTHQVCHAVIVTALEEGVDGTQATFIEEVCTVSTNQADMAVIKLTKDRYGHLVVLAMLKVSRHKQVHNLLKASILCKQEDVVENEFAAKVLKTIKTEFHSRTAGNYSK